MVTWKLQCFELCLRQWIANDEPSFGMRQLAVDWAISRAVDPYREATRVTGANGGPNRWYALVPVPSECQDVVVAEFDILEIAHAVECDGISTIPANVMGKY